ncbi:hypothetical protein FRC03_003146 [Tulasnella sp. 419]|nr:hypothetical protein FRC03_003146 [Tulasnella sp. 419]
MGPLQAFEGQVASPLVFILDALDECSNQDHITELIVLLSYLLRDLRPKINVKIMVTGRPEAHIRGQFMSPTLESISSISHLHDIDRSIVGSDIRLYLDHHLNKIKYEMLPGMASWPQEGEMDALVRMADGLFIYASAAVTYLRVQPIKRMKIILASVQHQKAASAFRHLDALYRQILQSAETLDPDADEEDGAEILEELHTILGTIVVLLDPLCARSLELLLGLEQGTVQPALRPFHSVLSISSPPYPIRVFHKSFPDFLSDQGRSDVNSWYHVDTKRHHTRLALLCLNHMNVMLQRNMCGVGDLEKNEIPDLERLLDEKVKPHLLYACHHWGTHLSQAEHSEALDGALHNFCMTKLLHWLEILSLTGKLNTGVQALTLVKDWCDPNNVVLGTILNDCYRFLLLFRDIFAIGPSHIYQSGLPFMPDCELFNIMQKEANVTVKYGKPQGWSNILFRLQMDSESFIRSISISPDCTLVAVGFMGGDISIWSTKYDRCP